jgi:hypothetical protein
MRERERELCVITPQLVFKHVIDRLHRHWI